MNRRSVVAFFVSLVLCLSVITLVVVKGKKETIESAKKEDALQILNRDDDTRPISSKSNYDNESVKTKEYKFENVSKLTKLQLKETQTYVSLLKSPDKNISVDIEYKVKLQDAEKEKGFIDAIDLESKITDDTCTLALKKLPNGKDIWSLLDGVEGIKSNYVNMKIYVPENMKDFSIETNTGYIYALGVDGDMDISSDTGYVTIEDGSGNMNVTTNTGYISLNNVNLNGTCDFTSETGYITCKIGDITEDNTGINLTTDMGYIDCQLEKKLTKKSKIDMLTTMGYCQLAQSSENSISYTNKEDTSMNGTIDDVCDISATTSMGQVIVE